MELNYTESDILLKNAESLGINLIGFYDEVGRLIAEKLIASFGKNKAYGIICGKGGNAADGLATAYHLSCLDVKEVIVFLAARKNQFDSTFAEDIYIELEEKAKESINLEIKNDCFAKDIESKDVMVEALVGTGFEGENLHKRFKDIIKRIIHFNKPIIAIDIASPHYIPENTFSILYPKAKDASVIDIHLPKELNLYCGPGEREALWVPNTKTHKNKNGSLLYFSQDGENINVVTEVCNDYTTNVFSFSFNNPTKNNASKTQIQSTEIELLIQESDTVLLGDINKGIIEFATINYIMDIYNDVNWVITGTSCNLVDQSLFKKTNNIVFVLNFDQLGTFFQDKNFKTTSYEGKIRRFCIQNKVNMVLVSNAVSMYNEYGDMKRIPIISKSKSKDIFEMASYIAAFSTKNDLWLSMRAVMG